MSKENVTIPVDLKSIIDLDFMKSVAADMKLEDPDNLEEILLDLIEDKLENENEEEDTDDGNDKSANEDC